MREQKTISIKKHKLEMARVNQISSTYQDILLTVAIVGSFDMNILRVYANSIASDIGKIKRSTDYGNLK